MTPSDMEPHQNAFLLFSSLFHPWLPQEKNSICYQEVLNDSSIWLRGRERALLRFSALEKPQILMFYDFIISCMSCNAGLTQDDDPA